MKFPVQKKKTSVLIQMYQNEIKANDTRDAFNRPFVRTGCIVQNPSFWMTKEYNSLQDKPTWTSQAWVVFAFGVYLSPFHFRYFGSIQFLARYSRPLAFLGTSTPSSQSKSALGETAAERTGVRSCSNDCVHLATLLWRHIGCCWQFSNLRSSENICL